MHRRLPSPRCSSPCSRSSSLSAPALTPRSCRELGQVEADQGPAGQEQGPRRGLRRHGQHQGRRRRGAQIAPGSVGSALIGDGSVSFGDLETAAQPDRDLDLLKKRPDHGRRPGRRQHGPRRRSSATGRSPSTATAGTSRQPRRSATRWCPRARLGHGVDQLADDFNPRARSRRSPGTLASGTDCDRRRRLRADGLREVLNFGVIGVNKTGGQTDCLYRERLGRLRAGAPASARRTARAARQ